MNPAVHFPSTWRMAIGKVLTNRRIRELELLGYYGKERQLKANKHTLLDASGHVIKCGCGSAIGVQFRRWSYLPKAGHYCIKCCRYYRLEAQKRREEEREWREQLAKGLVYE